MCSERGEGSMMDLRGRGVGLPSPSRDSQQGRGRGVGDERRQRVEECMSMWQGRE